MQRLCDTMNLFPRRSFELSKVHTLLRTCSRQYTGGQQNWIWHSLQGHPRSKSVWFVYAMVPVVCKMVSWGKIRSSVELRMGNARSYSYWHTFNEHMKKKTYGSWRVTILGSVVSKISSSVWVAKTPAHSAPPLVPDTTLGSSPTEISALSTPAWLSASAPPPVQTWVWPQNVTVER